MCRIVYLKSTKMTNKKISAYYKRLQYMSVKEALNKNIKIIYFNWIDIKKVINIKSL